MVGRRNRSYHPDQSANGKQDISTKKTGDIESGNRKDYNKGDARPRPNLFSFKDAAHTALEQERREELKNRLLNGLEEVDVKKFRKSDDEVCTLSTNPAL